MSIPKKIERALRYVKSNRHFELNVGDVVLRGTNSLSRATSVWAASLAPKREGLYEVVTQVSRLTYGLTRISANEQSGHIHVTDLNRYILRDQDNNEREAGERDVPRSIDQVCADPSTDQGSDFDKSKKNSSLGC